jgi:hypothetical protein
MLDDPRCLHSEGQYHKVGLNTGLSFFPAVDGVVRQAEDLKLDLLHILGSKLTGTLQLQDSLDDGLRVDLRVELFTIALVIRSRSSCDQSILNWPEMASRKPFLPSKTSGGSVMPCFAGKAAGGIEANAALGYAKPFQLEGAPIAQPIALRMRTFRCVRV